MNAAHLEKLNNGQRAAVVHGIGLPDGRVGGPLLIIAGAGSGKTNTLAHRVAQLIISGADPRRILLMTFSRRAAAEMAKRETGMRLKDQAVLFRASHQSGPLEVELTRRNISFVTAIDNSQLLCRTSFDIRAKRRSSDAE